MANYQNIQPYSNMVHLMARFGGPEPFVKHLLAKGYQMGVLAERTTELWKIPLAVASGIVICRTYDFVENKWNAYQEKKAIGQSQKEDSQKQQQIQKELIMPKDFPTS